MKNKMEESYNLDHLTELEAESIFVLREVAAQFDRPAILFSGGKAVSFKLSGANEKGRNLEGGLLLEKKNSSEDIIVSDAA